jgi:hypothetical protein
MALADAWRYWRCCMISMTWQRQRQITSFGRLARVAFDVRGGVSARSAGVAGFETEFDSRGGSDGERLAETPDVTYALLLL